VWPTTGVLAVFQDPALSEIDATRGEARAAFVVPVKSLQRVKQRLGAVLSLAARRQLMLAMAQDVLDVLSQIEDKDVYLLASDEAPALQSLALGQATLLTESNLGASGLNAALTALAALLKRRGYSKMIVVHADLPRLTPAFLRRFAGFLDRYDVVVAADQRGSGTNLLGWALSEPFITQFGQNSLELHQLSALQRGLTSWVLRDESSAADIDLPEDLRTLEQHQQGLGPHTMRWLQDRSKPSPGEERHVTAGQHTDSRLIISSRENS
jgi:2-phospho-L-lactate guanylyltransferase